MQLKPVRCGKIILKIRPCCCGKMPELDSYSLQSPFDQVQYIRCHNCGAYVERAGNGEKTMKLVARAWNSGEGFAKSKDPRRAKIVH